jgi:hypothetical protein
MALNDIINGAFELSGSYFCWRNVYQIYKEKRTMGVYIPTWMFFTSWGIWNLYYYPSLDQMFSFFGGISLVLANLVWVVLAVIYKRRYK